MLKAHLDDVLSLSEHRGRVQLHPILAGSQVGRVEEDVSPLLERSPFPFSTGLEGHVDGLADLLRRRVGELGHYVLMVRRLEITSFSSEY